MTVLIKLALMFSKLCVFAFGGGYVMIPIMLKELETNGLASASQLTDVVAVAGMSPGPVAVNAAIGLGYKVAGIMGSLSAVLGMVIPNLLIIIIVAVFFFKLYDYPIVKDVFYGLRPVITGIILFAAVSFAFRNNIIAAPSGELIKEGYNIFIKGAQVFEVKSIAIMIVSFIVLMKTKIHPAFVIAGSGIMGIMLF